MFPQDSHRDPIVAELLGVEISSFSVKEKTSCWDLEKSLVASPK